MEKIFLYILIFFLSGYNTDAQNLLSPVWKISFGDTSISGQNMLRIDGWKDVNLLLSWERQGFFWQNGKCCIAADFYLPKIYKDSAFSLTIGLQCYVQNIYINGIYIGGNIPNQFWTNRGNKTVYSIPDNCLLPGKINRIAIIVSDLSYTGGKSFNYCQIHPSENKHSSNIEILFPVPDNLFSVEKQDIGLRIKTTARQAGAINFVIRNDCSDTLVNRTFETKQGNGEIIVNLKEYSLRPGFYECIAIQDDGTYSGCVKWFAVSPERIECNNDTISGFKHYWNNALDELKNINPEFSMHKVDSLSIGKRDGYVVEMRSLGNIIVRGYYFVPRSAGSYPAVLHLPGYSYGFEDLGPFLGSKDNVIELALCVRGHGISADVFNPGFGVPGIWGYKLCDEKENAYRSIYMDCVRAVEFLVSRREVDKRKIGVEGGSQGGGLALATAGLCREYVSACAFFDPFPCDTRDHLKIRRLIKQEIQSYLNYYTNECSFEQALHIQDLINTKGFAHWIKCPVFYATSLFDDDCPPHIGFSAYNIITSPKKYKIYPEDSHLCESSQHKDLMIFFKNLFEY
jgi:cephalosporin-C deacetylase-like acetyl esterase